jgi:hypothetical protein
VYREARVTDWLDEVGRLTEEHRVAKAERFAKLARRKVFARREQGYSEIYAQSDAGWYRARADGQLKRFQRVDACGSEVLTILCVSCNRMHERRAGCRIGLLCVPCRSAIAATKRRAFVRARRVVIEDAIRRGLLNPSRKGGRWSEKLLTLTAWHDVPSIQDRIRRVLLAWRQFLRKLNDFWRAGGVRSAAWLRVFEWTPGSDDYGHPHLHIWIFSPFLERDMLEGWWHEALAEHSESDVPGNVVIDIREAKSSGAEHELIKYLTKDITANGEKIAPELYAEVYRTLDGQRSTQPSRGFMGLAGKAERQCECGCTLPKRVRRVRDAEKPGAKEASKA